MFIVYCILFIMCIVNKICLFKLQYIHIYYFIDVMNIELKIKIFWLRHSNLINYWGHFRINKSNFLNIPFNRFAETDYNKSSKISKIYKMIYFKNISFWQTHLFQLEILLLEMLFISFLRSRQNFREK